MAGKVRALLAALVLSLALLGTASLVLPTTTMIADGPGYTGGGGG